MLLNGGDISLSDQELHISRTMQKLENLNVDTNKKTYINIAKPKNKHLIRKVPILDNIMDSLQQAYINERYLLTSSTNKFIEPRTMENRFKSILKNCGIESANFHTLRRSYATRCIEAGVDVNALLKCMNTPM